ncbi:MAG: hypothetical protein GY739_05335 [Mesoflavibacter sp.]|nr:hypothetical protein [Mesoflavibacter sp.]
MQKGSPDIDEQMYPYVFDLVRQQKLNLRKDKHFDYDEIYILLENIVRMWTDNGSIQYMTPDWVSYILRKYHCQWKKASDYDKINTILNALLENKQVFQDAKVLIQRIDDFNDIKIFAEIHNLYFKNEPMKSMNINRFNTHIKSTKEFIYQTLFSSEDQNLNHIVNLQTLGLTASESDPTKLFIQPMFEQFVVLLTGHIVQKFQKKNKACNPVCYSPCSGLYVVKFDKLMSDYRLKHIWNKAPSQEIIQQLFQFATQESFEIVQCGSLFHERAVDGSIHSETDSIFIQNAEGMLTNTYEQLHCCSEQFNDSYNEFNL